MGNPVSETEENSKLCICPTCPTHMQSHLNGQVFCAIGKAKETAKTAGCICPACQVFKNYALDQMYYCVKGKSADIKA